jgi:hypothetical protein
MREYCGPANGVAAPLDSAPGHQVHSTAKPFFQVLLERTHFKKPNFASRQKLNKQIDVAPGPAGAARQGTKQIDPGNRAVFTNGADYRPDFIQRRWCYNCRCHSGYLAHVSTTWQG